MQKKLRQIILLVAALNFSYFGIEFFYALLTHSVSLMADSIDFLEDAAMSILVFFAALWSLAWRRRVGFFLAANMAVPALATIWLVYHQITLQIVPQGNVMVLVSLGALVVNIFCALLLLGYQQRQKNNNLLRAVYLSSRNDAITNLAIIFTGVATLVYPSIWPDIVVGVFIALLHGQGAVEVYQKSRKL